MPHDDNVACGIRANHRAGLPQCGSQMIDWSHATPSILASFLASLVEFVEALTIILAVGTVRGWRPAILGTLGGVVLLVLVVLGFGPSLQRVPIANLQLVIGVLLLLFGMRWLRKAILRGAGIIGLHDEEAIFRKQTKKLEEGEAEAKQQTLDWVGFLTTFKAVVLEGLEVVFIVLATGAVGHMIIPASIGAAAALIIVVILGLLIHKPLAKVPENTLKFAVGVLLSSFGVFWVGEGLKLPWPGDDLSLFGLTVGFLVTSLLAVSLIKSAREGRGQAI